MMKSERMIFLLILFLVILLPVNSQDKPTAKQASETGEQLYVKNCITCHQADGNGVRGMFPPLAGNSKITGPADSVIAIVLFGLEGPIVVNGRDYNQLMPAQDYLNDKQIADILTYVRSSWGNKAPAIKTTDVAKIRKSGKGK